MISRARSVPAVRFGEPRLRAFRGLTRLGQLGRRRRLPVLSALFMLIATMAFTTPATATHPEVSLANSDFEIDSDANLKADDDQPSIDWATVTEIRKQDTESGQNDNAFGQGSKEDTPVPSVVLGGVPPNKSDLKFFGVYTERNANGNFLHLFWTRVQDPSGTTLMDFEFNRNKCDPADPAGSVCSGNGVTPLRTAGDLLITYELAQGGTVAELFLYRWLESAADGTCEASKKYPCWGEQVALNDSDDAVGSINSTFIPAADADGLSATGLDPRTFGEATIDLEAIFSADKCESFGSAYLKSRSSDSFTAALKDFIAPEPVNLSNCGTVIVRKMTDPTPDPTATSFGFTSNLAIDPPEPVPYDPRDFELADDESLEVLFVLAGSYYVTEDDPDPQGFDLTSIDCSASDTAIDPTTNPGTRTASFIVGAGETVDCTFTNKLRQGKIIVDKVTNPPGSTQSFDYSLTGGDVDETFSLTDAAEPFDSGFIVAGTYTVAETVPDGWTLESATCDDDDGSNPATIVLDADETVTCTFTNSIGAIQISKTTKNATAGSPQPLGGVTFQITDADGNVVATPVTDDNGEACVDGLIVGDTYTVTETAAPAGYDPDAVAPQDIVAAPAECGGAGTPAAANFVNDPLSKITIEFESLAGQGVTVATSVQCTGPGTYDSGELVEGFLGDDVNPESVSITDLVEGTYTCVIVVDP